MKFWGITGTNGKTTTAWVFAEFVNAAVGRKCGYITTVEASDSFRQHIAEVGGAVVINSCELERSFATERVVIPPEELDRLIALMESNS